MHSQCGRKIGAVEINRRTDGLNSKSANFLLDG